MSMMVPATRETTLNQMSGYCAVSGAMTAARSGVRPTSMTASHGSLRYHGHAADSAADGSARVSGVRRRSGCGSGSDGRVPLGGIGLGSDVTGSSVAESGAMRSGVAGVAGGRE